MFHIFHSLLSYLVIFIQFSVFHSLPEVFKGQSHHDEKCSLDRNPIWDGVQIKLVSFDNSFQFLISLSIKLYQRAIEKKSSLELQLLQSLKEIVWG